MLLLGPLAPGSLAPDSMRPGVRPRLRPPRRTPPAPAPPPQRPVPLRAAAGLALACLALVPLGPPAPPRGCAGRSAAGGPVALAAGAHRTGCRLGLPWTPKGPGPGGDCRQPPVLHAAGGAEVPGTFLERKEALKRCLAREYRSFFRPFEAEFYSEDVAFKDPLNDLKGKDKYRSNVEMLSGESLIGNVLFRDGFIDLHAVEDVPGDERRVRTRWTLGFTFQLLPWQPQALFSGVSEYVIDAEAKVLSQRDYWDTLSLGDGGTYSPEAAAAGFADLGTQLLPAGLRPPAASEPPAAASGAWALLRRAEEYRVYRCAQSGRVFAIGAPGGSGDRAGLERALRGHGLAPGAALRVRAEGQGDVLEVADPEAEDGGGGVPGVELLLPHPWQGAPPPG